MGKKVKAVDVSNAPMPEILETLPRTDACAQALRDQVEANERLAQENRRLAKRVRELEAENAMPQEQVDDQPVQVTHSPRRRLPDPRSLLSGNLSLQMIVAAIAIGLGIGLVIKVFFG